MNFGGGYGGGGGGYQSVDPYGGGGGYGGGGFIQGSQGFPSPGLESSPGGGKGRGKPQNTKPITSAQLQTLEDMGENTFKMDDKDIGMVCIVGEVMEVKEQPTSIMYMIDDRTGPWVKVQRWLEEQSSPIDPSERSACREGMYVRAVGNVKTFSNQKSITAFSVKPVEDFNEISKHLSQVMVAHLTAVKGAPVPQQFKGQQSAEGWETPVATSTQVASHQGGVYSGAQQHDSGLNPIQQQALNVIAGCRNDHGISVPDLIRAMSQHGHGEANVRHAVDFLCNEGHIYSTVDDNHFKSTDA